MQLFKPQIWLVKKANSSGGFDYYLHVVTYLSQTNYKSDGLSGSLPDRADANGMWEIKLKVSQNNGPPLSRPTPVNHTVHLGPFPLSDSAPLIKVVVEDPLALTPVVGKGVIHQSEAEEDAMPIQAHRQQSFRS